MNTTPTTTTTGEASQDLCSNSTDFGCGPNGPFGSEKDVTDDFLEQEVSYGLRLWHIIFLATGTVLSLVILLCCCIKFRIPRTKQEIEADYIRRKILRKFRSRLKAIQNQELDEMDLKCALDKIRAEFKSDTESLAQSEAGFSVGTISSSVLAGEKGHNSSTYRRASQIANEISLEDLRAHSMGVAGRLSLAFSKFFGRSKVGQTPSTSQTKAPEKPKGPPPAPPLPAKSKNEAQEQKQTATTVDETKKVPKKPTESKKKEKKEEKPSKTKDSNDAKTVEQKPESKSKEQQKPPPKGTKSEKQADNNPKKSKSTKDTIPVAVDVPPEGPLKQGKVPDKNCPKEAAKLKKELEKEKKRPKEQLEKEKKEQAKREKLGSEKEKSEKTKQEKEKDKLEKQKKEREKQEKEKEAKKQKGKPEKESKKGKDGK